MSQKQRPRETVSSPAPPAAPSSRRPRFALLLVAGLALLAALGARFWYEQGKPGTVSDPAEAERQARANPKDLEAQLAWGTALQNTKRSEEAVQVFTNAARLAPNDPRAYAWLGFLGGILQKGGEAKQNLRKAAELGSTDPDVWRALTDLHTKAGETTEAVRAGERLTQLRPDDAQAWYLFATACTRARLSYRALEAYRRAANLNTGDITYKVDLAASLMEAGDLGNAQGALVGALAKKPDDPTALALSARLALRLDPSPDNLAKAERQINRAIELRPTGTAHITRGEIYLAGHRYPEAIREFKAVLAKYPDLISAHVFLSQAYAATGQKALAQKASADYRAASAKVLQRNAAKPDSQEVR